MLFCDGILVLRFLVDFCSLYILPLLHSVVLGTSVFVYIMWLDSATVCPLPLSLVPWEPQVPNYWLMLCKNIHVILKTITLLTSINDKVDMYNVQT